MPVKMNGFLLALDLQGLKHLHDNQLCHLDIKPANIFLGQDNFTCKIGDFGLCSNVDQGLSEAMEGDSKYLAPELMSRQFGKPADIFRYDRYGVIKYEFIRCVCVVLELACWKLPVTWNCPQEGNAGTC